MRLLLTQYTYNYICFIGTLSKQKLIISKEWELLFWTVHLCILSLRLHVSYKQGQCCWAIATLSYFRCYYLRWEQAGLWMVIQLFLLLLLCLILWMVTASRFIFDIIVGQGSQITTIDFEVNLSILKVTTDDECAFVRNFKKRDFHIYTAGL